MEVKFKKRFFKDYEKLPVRIKDDIGKIVFDEFPNHKSFQKIQNIKKIKGYKNFYRIKCGQYRVGFEYNENIIVFYRVLHRKDIYKYFP